MISMQNFSNGQELESSTPLAAAVVAAPMRKLWPEYNELSKPACCNS